VKFTSSKSEDHVTWTVFRWLQTQGAIRNTISKVGIEFAHSATAEPILLLWGVPVPKEDRFAKGILDQLENVLEGIGEESNRRSEPDVILDFGLTGLVFIEVKLGSQNDTKRDDYVGWEKYITSTEAFLDPNKVKRSGLYELCRNWRIAWEMAKDRPMALINLGPGQLFGDDSRGSLQSFCESLHQSSTRRFVEVTWESFLGTISNKPEWFSKYVQERKIVRV
jgi:hypothetical protein